jgi:hypothetical protein
LERRNGACETENERGEYYTEETARKMNSGGEERDFSEQWETDEGKKLPPGS